MNDVIFCQNIIIIRELMILNKIISSQVHCVQSHKSQHVGVSDLQWVLHRWARIFCLFLAFIRLLLCIATLLFCENRIKWRSLMNLLPGTWHLTHGSGRISVVYLKKKRKFKIQYFFGSSFSGIYQWTHCMSSICVCNLIQFACDRNAFPLCLVVGVA